MSTPLPVPGDYKKGYYFAECEDCGRLVIERMGWVNTSILMKVEGELCGLLSFENADCFSDFNAESILCQKCVLKWVKSYGEHSVSWALDIILALADIHKKDRFDVDVVDYVGEEMIGSMIELVFTEYEFPTSPVHDEYLDVAERGMTLEELLFIASHVNDLDY